MIQFNTIVSILGGLSIFLFGMKIMSEGLQNVAGYRLRSVLRGLTNNRFSGILTGFLITTAVQSSSASTVMLVSFVNAGLINLTQSLGVVLGANIGTTVTGWLIAIIGFKFNISLFAFPAITAGFFLRFFGKQKLTDWGEVLLGFGLLFFGLSIMRETMGDLRHSQEVIEFMSRYHAHDFLSILAVVGVGTAITIIIQSSSATMALTLSLASLQLIDFPTCAALILGENIGTTITANLAAVGASTAAKQTARAHLVFNLIGVFWVLMIFPFFLNIVNFIVPGDVYATGQPQLLTVLPEHLAAFHTIFNIINTLIFLPLINVLAWLARLMVKDVAIKQESKLIYLRAGLINTLPLAVEESKRELSRMSDLTFKMFNTFLEFFNKQEKTVKEKNEYNNEINEMENLVDSLEIEITDFLVKVIRNTSSTAISLEIEQTLNCVNNLERVGDHCQNLMKFMNRLDENNLAFTEHASRDINLIADKVQKMLTLVNSNISKHGKNIMYEADRLENEIDELRHDLRKAHIERLNAGSCNVNQGLIFIDMLNCFEKIGDHLHNIAQAISGER